ncbi:unnamed protein product [Caenorhabditis angaria]|uniref:DUF19 domain-containing protein n=1 Tax=Caenorhabditis angaria TaxID=860376 RepID=A0A9P1IZ26_9PELO|nr:unnamed protein product [Caenorhabditis angaria]
MNRIFVLFVTLFYSSNSINIPQRYLEQCENTNSTEIGKCLNSTDNCEIFLGCMAEIQCKPIDEDYKNQLDSCWKSVFMEKFGECRKKLIEAKANCQKDKLKNMTQNPELRACNNIRDSKTSKLFMKEVIVTI